MIGEIVDRKLYDLHGEWFQISVSDSEVQIGIILPRKDRQAQISNLDRSNLIHKQAAVQKLIAELTQIDQEITNEIKAQREE